MLRILFLAYSSIIFLASPSFAAHPLVTDDTGTQGAGKFQIEINGEYASHKTSDGGVSTEEAGSEVGVIFSYGIGDSTDLVLGLPYQRYQVKEDDVTLGREDGLSDIAIEVKHRYYEKDGLSLGVKPAVTLPTGDEEKGLGTGKPSYGITFIATKELAPLTLHLNAGYSHGEYKLDADVEANRKGIWHLSLASEYAASESMKLAANIGMERNADKASNTNPAFALAGIIYSLSENVDINGGVKAGLNDAETATTWLAGMTMRL